MKLKIIEITFFHCCRVYSSSHCSFDIIMIKELMHDPIFLGQKSEEATPADIHIAEDLMDTLVAHRDECVGMAANMIGVKKRIICFDADGTYMTMFNPQIIKFSQPFKIENNI